MVLVQKLKGSWLRIATHVGALLPLVLLAWAYVQDRLTVDPVREITLRTGRGALILLTLSLACTPAHTLLGRGQSKPAQNLRQQVIRVRRPLGLYAFLHASLHLSTFVGLDYGFDLALIGEEILQKRFIQVGLLAFLILVPLAVTSTRGWRRRLGKNWRRLHRLVYVAALFAVLHFLWLVKADLRRPLIYGTAIAVLLAARIPRIVKAEARTTNET